MTTEIGPELVELFNKLRTTDVSDALDSMGIMDRQTMNAEMRPLWEGCTFAGLARTVQLYPSTRVLTSVSYEEYDAQYGSWTDGSYAWSSEVGKTPDQVWVIDEGGISAGLVTLLGRTYLPRALLTFADALIRFAILWIGAMLTLLWEQVASKGPRDSATKTLFSPQRHQERERRRP